jgi:Na+/phosphate symporter
MEEKRLSEMLSDVFDEALPVLQNARKGFVRDNGSLLEESITKFRRLLKSRITSAEAITKKEERNEEEDKYVSMVIPLQTAALAIENVMEKMAIKAEAKIPFTEKALKEIDSLLVIVYAQLVGAKDYVTTRNPNLKANIRKNMEEIKRLADEYDLVHQNRLITGVCIPKASYLYIDITDSLKRVARALVQFSEKV